MQVISSVSLANRTGQILPNKPPQRLQVTPNEIYNAPELAVARGIHFAHPARANLRDDFVAPNIYHSEHNEITRTMITILGAGGPISNELARILAANQKTFRLVSRNPKQLFGAQVFAADLADPEQTIRAVAGSSVVHLLVGLKYDLGEWQELWPRIMANTIRSLQEGASEVKKGEVRARIATKLMDEVKAGNLTAMIARSADFYGPKTKHGVPNVLSL